MLRYRVLLVDTETSYRRPIQAYFNTLTQVDDWIEKVLPSAKKKAWVEIYESMEKEIGRINHSDLKGNRKLVGRRRTLEVKGDRDQKAEDV